MKKNLLILGALAALGVALAPESSLDSQVRNLPENERADFKASEIAKVQFGEHQRGNLKLKVEEVQKLDGGVAVFVKAWKNEEQLAFGDGTVEIERFRIYNPPILVEDPNGPIERTSVVGGVTYTEHFRADPQEAVLQSIEHTIAVTKPNPGTPIPGKIGNTTSTFYPSAGAVSPVDGAVQHVTGGLGTGVVWSSLNSAAGSGASNTDGAHEGWQAAADNVSGNWRILTRPIFLFDTTTIGTDVISSATLSIYGQTKSDGCSITPDFNIYSSAPAANDTLAAGDFDAGGLAPGSTDLATAISWASWTNETYNDFTLNASGIANITAGVSKFAMKNDSYDNDTVAPTWSSECNTYPALYFADAAGTTKDPKLVVVHAAAGITGSPEVNQPLLFF